MSSYQAILKEGVVYIQYNYDQEVFEVSTSVRVNPAHFKKGAVLALDTKAEYKNMMITEVFNELLQTVGKVRASGQEPTVMVVSEAWTSGGLNEPVFTFFDKVDAWLMGVKRSVSNQTYRNTKNAMDSARKFEQDTGMKWDIDLLDRDFYTQYVQYLVIDRGLLDTTVARYVRTVRQFLVEHFHDTDFSYFQHTLFQENIVWLHQGELIQLNALQIASPYDKIRDLLLFSVATGMRYKDTQRYEPSWADEAQDNLVEYPQLYDKNQQFTSLPGVAAKILKAYGGAPPKLSAQDYTYGVQALFNVMEFHRPVDVMVRENGKWVKKTKPFYLAIHREIGMQTFIMQLLINKVDIRTVMDFAGHQDYRTFMAYIDLSRRYIAEGKVEWKF